MMRVFLAFTYKKESPQSGEVEIDMKFLFDDYGNIIMH